MKQSKHIADAIDIGDSSFELINFMQLPKRTSSGKQVDALKADRQWLETHHVQVIGEINKLIDDIERDSNA